MATLLLGRTAIGERVWDISCLIDVITKHCSEYVDTDKIVCLGNSGSGTATFYASCLDERIFLSVPSCSVCTFDDSIMAMWHCPCNFIPGIRKYFDMGDLGCLIAVLFRRCMADNTRIFEIRQNTGWGFNPHPVFFIMLPGEIRGGDSCSFYTMPICPDLLHHVLYVSAKKLFCIPKEKSRGVMKKRERVFRHLKSRCYMLFHLYFCYKSIDREKRGAVLLLL